MIRVEDVRLPELSPDATEADRRLLQALYDQFRDHGARLGAIEATIGTVPRRSKTLGYATSPLTTKGDVWGYSTVNARIPVGSNGQRLTADSTQALGLKWQNVLMGASAVATGTQSINNNAITAVTFDSETSPEWDTDTIHSTASNTSRFTVPTGGAGKWTGVGGVTWDADTAGTVRIAYWRVNGTTDVAGSGYALPPTAAGPSIQSVMPPLILADGDYVELVVYQNSGGTRTIGSGSLSNISSKASVWRLG